MCTISVNLFFILNILTSSMAYKEIPTVCLFIKEKMNLLDLVGSWMTVYTQPRSVSCFVLHIRATTDIERDLASVKFGDFKGRVNWNKCLLEVESPLGKHYLQDTNNQTGLLDNVIITETEKGKYELHDQNADMWTVFGQKGSELLVMRDCEEEAVAIFARVPYWPEANDLYAVLHRSRIAPLVVDKVICSPLDNNGLVFAECPDTEDIHEEARLHEFLVSCSSKFRPVKYFNSTINVYVRLALKYITFDDTEDKITVHSWVAIKWKDEFLKWNPSDFSNIKEIQMESNDIWTPPLELMNADASEYQMDSIDTTCLVTNDGIVTCVPQMSHTAICKTSPRLWPYDEKKCTLNFGSTTHTPEQVNYTFYKTRPVLMDDFQNGPGWKLLDVLMLRLSGKHSVLTNNTYPMLKYLFQLRREASGPAAIIIFPSVVIVLLTLSSLLLDIKDNTRLGLICFSLLGHFIFITEIDYFVPKLSAETPIILLFIRDSLIVTLIGVLETLLLMCLRRRVVPAPSWVVSVNSLVASGPGKYVVFTEFDPCEREEGRVITEDSGRADNDEKTRITADWIKFANLVNSCVFIVSLLIYLVLLATKI